MRRFFLLAGLYACLALVAHTTSKPDSAVEDAHQPEGAEPLHLQFELPPPGAALRLHEGTQPGQVGVTRGDVGPIRRQAHVTQDFQRSQ